MSAGCQVEFAVRRVWAPTLYWLEDAPRGEDEREPPGGPLGRRDVDRLDELAAPTDEVVDVHDRGAMRGRRRDRPLHRPSRSSRWCDTPANVVVVEAISSMISAVSAYDMG